MVINKGFRRKREPDRRLPPGQYETKDFPVLTFGATPKIDKSKWSFEVYGEVENRNTWGWPEFLDLPMITFNAGVHCVTRWSKFDTNWKGVSLDHLIKLTKPTQSARFIIVHSYDGYSTNLPVKDIIDGQAMVAVEYDYTEIPREHGGPARLLVPHLYFWKSAKWLKSIEFVKDDNPGFWEVRGYHNYGDPWKEQRFSG